MSGVGKPPDRAAFGGEFGVGVGENNARRIGAEFKRHFFNTGGARDLFADCVTSGERYLAHARILAQRFADRAAAAGYALQCAVGRSGFNKYLGKFEGGKRRGGGRFENHRVADGEGGRDFVQHEQDRKIKRRDGDDNAARFRQCDAEFVVRGRNGEGVQRQGFAAQVCAFKGGEAQNLRGAIGFAARFGDGFADFGDHYLREFFGALLAQIGGAF